MVSKPKNARGNSLSGAEVALIKGLLAQKKFSNQEIAGMINRARGDASNDISSGRVSNIKNDQIKKYVTISASIPAQVAAFLLEFDSAELGHSPATIGTLKRFLPVRCTDPLTLDITETDQIECKASLNVPMKTIAAFANNKGGYLIFGVENKTWRVLGLPDDRFEKYDLNKLNQNIRDSLGIGIVLSPKLFSIHGKKVGVIHVGQAHTRPVIFIHNTDGASQGHIYYRYPGEDRLISPTDLQHVIEARIQQLSQTILSKHLSNILRFGVENSAILNLSTGEVDGKSGSFMIDETLLPKISFVKEGEFVEKSGSPALNLIGSVESAKGINIYSPKEIVDMYPLSYSQLFSKIKSNINFKQTDLTAIMKLEKIKSNTLYSHFVFKKASDRDNYEITGKYSNNTPSLYNEAAVSFLTLQLEKLAKSDA